MGIGWACSEGDRVVLQTVTEDLPVVQMAGRTLLPTRLVRAGPRFVAQYEVFIDTWAGTTTLAAQNGPERQTITLEVRPHEFKLGADAFEAMLAELSEHSAGLIWGLSPGASRGVVSSGALAVVHPAVLDSQLPVFERLLARFIAEPPTVTVRTRGARALDLTRRVDLATLRRLGRQPAVLRALRGDGIAGGLTDPRTPIDQPLSLSSYDHPVTRYVAHLLRRLAARFLGSAHALRTATGRPFPDPAVEAHAAFLAGTMDRAVVRIETASARPLFRHVRPEPIGESALQALADQPLFGALHRVGQRMLDPGLAHGPGGDLRSSLKPTYELFELFVLFRLIGALSETLGSGWSLRRGRPLRYAGREERPPDRAAWWYDGPDGLTLELRYQQWFSRGKSAPDGRLFASLSGVGIPDYILVLRRAGKPLRWLILDAKYRSGQQAVERGLADVHRYRDALRVRGLKAVGAFIVVPRLRDENAPYAAIDYHEHHSFGVLQLFAANWLRPVQRALTAQLGNDRGRPEVPVKPGPAKPGDNTLGSLRGVDSRVPVASVEDQT